MHCTTISWGAFVGACFVQHGLTAPLPQGDLGPVEATGSLYGPGSFLGNDAGSEVTAHSAVVSNYELVPVQQADSDVGLFLDFTTTPNPQPLRGSNGYTDAGPRMTCCRLFVECGYSKHPR